MTKSIKRVLSFILCIIILICGSNVAYALSDETVLYNFEYPEEHPNQNFYNYPNLKNSAGPNVEKIEAVVDIDTFRKHLIDNFASCPNYVDIRDFKIPNTTENQDAIRSYIWYETPELFQPLGVHRKPGLRRRKLPMVALGQGAAGDVEAGQHQETGGCQAWTIRNGSRKKRNLA